MNKLILHGGKIILEGFEKLENITTFSFYPSGVVIFLTKKEHDGKDYYFDVEIIEHEINNLDLYNKLKERLPEHMESINFVFAIDSYIQQL